MQVDIVVEYVSGSNLPSLVRPSRTDIYVQGDVWHDHLTTKLNLKQKTHPARCNVHSGINLEDSEVRLFDAYRGHFGSYIGTAPPRDIDFYDVLEPFYMEDSRSFRYLGQQDSRMHYLYSVPFLDNGYPVHFMRAQDSRGKYVNVTWTVRYSVCEMSIWKINVIIIHTKREVDISRRGCEQIILCVVHFVTIRVQFI